MTDATQSRPKPRSHHRHPDAPDSSSPARAEPPVEEGEAPAAHELEPPSSADRDEPPPPEVLTAEPPGPGGEETAEATGALGKQLEEARAEAVEQKDRALRIAAELENYRRRAAKDVAEASRGARERILRELLPVFDLLGKAATHADTSTDAKAVAEGVRLIIRQFDDVTAKLGVVRLKTEGLPFDPNLHEAVSQVTVSGRPAGSIVAEVEAGYTWDGRLLRPAKVVVAGDTE